MMKHFKVTKFTQIAFSLFPLLSALFPEAPGCPVLFYFMFLVFKLIFIGYSFFTVLCWFLPDSKK